MPSESHNDSTLNNNYHEIYNDDEEEEKEDDDINENLNCVSPFGFCSDIVINQMDNTYRNLLA